jgi:hypothetical protein
MLLPFAAVAQTWDGSADTTWFTENKTDTEFTITTAEQLAGLARLVNGSSDNGTYDMSGITIKLGADIVLNDITANGGWQNWGSNGTGLKQWVPIGTWESTFNRKFFMGSFNGNGKVIRGLYINSTANYQGLLGIANNNATISNLGVAGFYVRGGDYVGGIMGSGSDGYGASLFSIVTNSYAIGNVSGSRYVGGIVGGNGGTVVNSYFAGNASGTIYLGMYDVGNIIGSYGTIVNSYYNSDLAAAYTLNSVNSISKTTAEMQSSDFRDALQFVASASNTDASNNYMGWTYNAGGYPSLSSSKAADNINIANYFASGNGTEANPYIIKTKEQLEHFSFLVYSGASFGGQYLKLGADIVLNDTTDWESWATIPPDYEWTAIGTSTNPFKGIFDGDGYVVSGVYINVPSQDHGFFGYVKEGAIKNLGIVASYIKSTYAGGMVAYIIGGEISNSYSTGNVDGGSASAGGLVGRIEGTSISNSYATGNVKSGGNTVGGLVGAGYGEIIISDSYATGDVNAGSGSSGGLLGYGESITISNSHATGDVKGGLDIGGLVGGTRGGEISNSYATGYVEGSTYIGGLVGLSNCTISNSHATGKVKGTDSNGRIGGLVGNGGGTISDSYATGDVEGIVYVGGLVGYYGGGTISNSYAEGNVDGSTYVGGLVGSNSGTISNSYATGVVKGTSSSGIVGGLVGHGGEISNSHATGNVVGNGSWVGGLVGRAGGTINNSYATGNVKGTRDQVGGLVGAFGVISDSYSMGNVEGTYQVGGLVGFATGPISNSYATGNVIGNDIDFSNNSYTGGLAGQAVSTISNSYATGNIQGAGNSVGGLAGSSLRVINSYALGNVEGNGTTGGLVGMLSGDSVIYSYAVGHVKGKPKATGGLVGAVAARTAVFKSYYNFETSGQIDINKGESRSTSQMKIKSTFNRWDLVEIWGLDSQINNGYPHLRFSVSSSSGGGGSSSSGSGVSSSSGGGGSSSSEGTTSIVANSSKIILQNIPAGAKIEVFGLNGKLITTSHSPLPTSHRGSDNVDISIPVQTKGMYIVRVSLNMETRYVLRVSVM